MAPDLHKTMLKQKKMEQRQKLLESKRRDIEKKKEERLQ